MTSGDLNARSSFVMIYDALSNAAYCASLSGPGAELDGRGGGVKHPRSGAFGAEHRPGAGNKYESTKCEYPGACYFLKFHLPEKDCLSFAALKSCEI